MMIVGGYSLYGTWKTEKEVGEEEIQISSVATKMDSSYSDDSGNDNNADKEDSYVKFSCFICGEVSSPGVYEVAEGKRINDLLELAGGFTAEADKTAVNLAEYLTDGQMVYVPKVGEDYAGSTGAASETAGPTIININKADATELTSLPGIGETKAKAIVSYRNENGSFKSIDELMNVSGIGQSTYDSLKDYITV